jgi:hypothetical protein
VKNILTARRSWLIGCCFVILISGITLLMLRHHEKTRVHQYQAPATASVKPIEDINLKCWQSGLSARSDAYACSANGQVDNAHRLDPCFLADDRQSISCPVTPDYNAQTYLAGPELLKNIVRKPVESSKSAPWYIVLQNGTGCRYYIGGATALPNGRIDYTCANGPELSLPINKSSNPWSIKCTSESDRSVRTCKIRDAWY